MEQHEKSRIQKAVLKVPKTVYYMLKKDILVTATEEQLYSHETTFINIAQGGNYAIHICLIFTVYGFCLVCV